MFLVSRCLPYSVLCALSTASKRLQVLVIFVMLIDTDIMYSGGVVADGCNIRGFGHFLPSLSFCFLVGLWPCQQLGNSK